MVSIAELQGVDQVHFLPLLFQRVLLRYFGEGKGVFQSSVVRLSAAIEILMNLIVIIRKVRVPREVVALTILAEGLLDGLEGGVE
jgi:hypothetical protein